MERKIPKNVRQIGNVSDNPKIYVEDYVDTFFNHLCDKGKESAVGAFLVGQLCREDDQDYMFIHGAIQMDSLGKRDKQMIVSDDVWRKGLKECKEYFDKASILGWLICAPDQVLEVNAQINKTHEKLFLKKSSLFVMRDSVTKDEKFYIYKYNDLMELGGHYIYYEKNPSMQNYMISKRKQNGVTPSETVEDRAAKDFRSIVKENEVMRNKRWKWKTICSVSTVLVLLVTAMGVTALNHYGSMKSIQASVIGNKEKATSKQSENAKKENSPSQSMDESNIEKENESDKKEKEDAPVVPQGDEEVSPVNQVYVVEKGDTLAIISTKQYGDISHIDAICKMNGLKNGNLIYEGQKLLLP